MKNIYFVLNINYSYINQASVTMASIVLNLNKNYSPIFYIFISDYKDSKLPFQFADFEQKFNAKINLIKTEDYLDLYNPVISLKEENKWFFMAIQRFLIFKILPDDITKAFYVDSDIIVNGDLSLPYEEFKSNILFSAVVDLFVLKHKNHFKKTYQNYDDFKKWCDNPLMYPYFNNGFFLANIALCKEMNIFEQLLERIKNNPVKDLIDQDAQNAIFAFKYSDKISYLDLKYNMYADAHINGYRMNKYYYSYKIKKEAYKHPVVIHFAGPQKPWKNYLTLNHVGLWWKYYNLSTAKGMKKPKFKWIIYHLIRKFIL